MKKTLVKVLLIEDNPADALLLQESLRGDLLADFQVTVAEWLRQGLAKLDTEEFDVLLLDLGLPDSQGLETFEEAHWAHPDIPMVVLSGMADELLALQAVQSGAQDYLVKGEAGWSLGPRAIRYAIERKRADGKLHRVEHRFRALIEKTAEMIVVISADGVIQYASPSSERIMGYKPEDALGLTFLDWVHPEDRSIALESLVSRSQIPGTAPDSLIVRGRHKDGTWRCIEALGTNLLADPAVQGIVLNMRDVTERAQAEERLRKLSRAVEQSPTSIIITDLRGSIEYVNPRFSEVTGYSMEEALGQNPRILKSGHTSDGEYKKLWEVITSGQVWQGEFLNQKKNGEIYWESATIAPVFDEDGRITNFLAVKENITERKQAEQALHESEERFRVIFEKANDAIHIANADDQILEVNSRMCELLAYSREELLKMHVADLQAPEVRAHGNVIKNELAQHGSGIFEGLNLHRDGRRIPVEISVGTIELPLEDLYVSVVRDVTERKKAEKLLRESEEHLRLAYDAADLGTWQEDLVTHIFTLDERARRHYDQDDEHLGTAEISSRVFPEDSPRLRAAIGSVLAPEAEGRLEVEYRVVHRDGSIHWLAIHARVHFEEQNGERTAIVAVGTSQDITERKDAEQKLIQRTRQLRLINEATRSLNTSLKASYVHEMIYTSVSQLMPCDTLFVSAFDPISQRISLTSGWHDGQPIDVSHYEPIPLEPEGSGIQSQVIRSKQSQLIPDFQERLKNTRLVHHFDNDDNPVDELPEDGDIPRSALVAPLLVEGQVFGVIQVFSYRANAYTEDDLQLLNGFSAQAAIALSNARLYESAQQENLERQRAEASVLVRTAQLEALFNISDHLGSAQTEQQALSVVMAEMESLMDAHAGAIVLVEPDRLHLKLVRAEHALTQNLGFRFPVEEGISGRVFRDGQPYLTDSYADDPLKVEKVVGIESFGPAVFAPIRAESEFIGVLVALRLKDPQSRPFDANSVRMLTAVGEITGSALRRVRLFEQTSSQLRQLQTLQKVDRAITGSLDLDLTLRLLLTEITSHLAVDAAAVLLLHPHSLILECAAAHGFHQRSIEQTHIMMGQDVAGRAALTHETIHITDLQNDANFSRRQMVAEEGFQSYSVAPLITKGKVVGVFEFYSRGVVERGPDWDDFLETLANQATIAIENARLFSDLQRSNLEMELAYDATIEGWSRAVDLRDHETEGHSVHVTEIALGLAASMGMGDADMIHLRWGALLHDIGKLGVPDEVLLKSSELTPEEWEAMRRHPIMAYELLHPIQFLRPALDIPYCHHEKWDGSGYPRGLMGEQIPLAARIFSVADVFGALISNRPYRPAWTRDKAIAYIEEQSGTHFDPQVVDAFHAWISTQVG